MQHIVEFGVPFLAINEAEIDAKLMQLQNHAAARAT